VPNFNPGAAVVEVGPPAVAGVGAAVVVDVEPRLVEHAALTTATAIRTTRWARML
jgi:hypothetical protein